ncbi:hypothetical protein ACROYT_G035941 [Oculina patagonica]
MMNITDKHNNGSADHHSGNEDNSAPGTILIINCVLNAPLMLISILGNGLVLAAIIRTPSIRSTSMIILCSLAVSDFLVGLIAQPLYIAQQLNTTNRLLHHAANTIGFSLCGVSLLTITAMGYATAFIESESRVKYSLATIWLISVGSQLWFKSALPTIAAKAIFFLSLIHSTYSYIGIYRIVRRHQLQIQSQQVVQSANAENNLNIIRFIRLKKSAVNTFVFFIFMIVCYLPLYLILFFTLRGSPYTREELSKKWYFVFSHTAVFMNSSINPFLYCWRLRELRTAVVKTAKQMLCKQTEEN